MRKKINLISFLKGLSIMIVRSFFFLSFFSLGLSAVWSVSRSSPYFRIYPEVPVFTHLYPHQCCASAGTLAKLVFPVPAASSELFPVAQHVCLLGELRWERCWSETEEKPFKTSWTWGPVVIISLFRGWELLTLMVCVLVFGTSSSFFHVWQ